MPSQLPKPAQNRPLLFLLPFFITGLILGRHLTANPGPDLWPMAAISAALMALAGLINRPRLLAGLLALTFVLTGAAISTSIFTPPADSRNIYNYRDREGCVFGGRVVERPRREGQRSYVTVEVDEALVRGGAPEAVAGRVRLTVLGDFLRIRGGERVRFPSVLKEISGFANPGGGDYQGYMNGRGVWVSGFLKDGRLLQVVDESLWSRWPWCFFQVRDSASRYLDRVVRPPALGLIKAMLLGIRDEVEPETASAFQSLGLSHLMAISGLHVGLVALAGYWIFFKFLLLWPSLARSHNVRRIATILAIFPVLFYTALAGGRPSTIRAFIMVAVFILAALAERKKDPLTALAAAAWIILLVQPAALFLPSFQLSFAAVAAIILVNERFNPLLLEPVETDGKSSFHRFFNLALISGAALVGTAPITAYHFNQAALLALPANIVFTPLIGLGVTPPGLIGLALAPVFPLASRIIFYLMERFVWMMLASVETLAAHNVFDFLMPKPGIFFLAAYYLAVFSFTVVRPARKAGLVGLAIVSSYGLVFLVSQNFNQENLSVTFLDVGHGNAAAIVFPDKTRMVLDGGGFPKSNFDTGESIVAPFLLSRGITAVDILALSHPQTDHVGGLPYLARNFSPRELWINFAPGYNPAYRELLQLAGENHFARPGLKQLHQGRNFGEVRVEALAPPVDFLSRQTREELLLDQNNNSLVLKITYGQISFLLPGDLEIRGEHDLVGRKGGELQADVLLASHHGGAASMTTEFLDLVKPRYIVFSVGRFSNRHPSPEALDRSRKTGAVILRTDLCGAVTFQTDGVELLFDTYKAR